MPIKIHKVIGKKEIPIQTKPTNLGARPIKVTCPNCQKQFKAIDNGMGLIFCSNSCRTEYLIRTSPKPITMSFRQLKSPEIKPKEKKPLKTYTVSRFTLHQRDGFRCAYCGKTSYEDNVKLDIDHIYPLHLGGSNHIDNLITSCDDCNVRKNAKRLDDETILSIWTRNKTINDKFDKKTYDELNDYFALIYKDRTKRKES